MKKTAQERIIELTLHVRDHVRPHLGLLQSRRVTGTAASGDATFAIDDIAEEAVNDFVRRERLPIAYYSEDKGLVSFSESPEAILVIDPIDGTRPAVAGFEQCVVSVAWADYAGGAPTMRDVRLACVAELKRDDIFSAERGKGVRWIDDSGRAPAPQLLPVTDLTDAPVSFEAVARGFEYLGPVLADIVDAASLKGGCFLFNSTAYSLTRLVTGQLAGVVDVGGRIPREFPQARDRLREIGGGKIVALFTYDIAAAALIASEAGAIVTDAYGRPLGDVPLLDTSEANHQTICAASNPAIHAALVKGIEHGFERLSRTRF